MKKTIIILTMCILLLNSVYAVKECKKFVTKDEVPCLILLPVNTTATSCNSINVTTWVNATNLSNVVMANYTPSMCNSNFTQTSFATYTLFYSTGDSGSITVQEDVNSGYYLYVVATIFFIFLITLGYYIKSVIPLTLSGFLLMLIGINLYFNGFPNLTSTFLINTMTIIFTGLGMILAVAPNVDYLEALF